MEENPGSFDRFKRQIMLPEIGLLGQNKIRNASVLLVGAGGLGSSVAYYLAAAGIGHIGIADDDKVEISDLNRQILYNSGRIGLSKVTSAKQTLKQFDPSTQIITHPRRFTTPEDLLQIINSYDIVIDCSDNYSTRLGINDACIKTRKPWIYGAVSGFEGQAMTIIPGKGPCYRCLYPLRNPPGEDDNAGVIGVSPGFVGLVQATEALKYILGKGKLLIGRLLFVDLLEMTVSEFKVERNLTCQSCRDVIHQHT